MSTFSPETPIDTVSITQPSSMPENEADKDMKRKKWLVQKEITGYVVRTVVHFPPHDPTQITDGHERRPYSDPSDLEHYADALEWFVTLSELHGRAVIQPGIAPKDLAAEYGFKPDVIATALLIPASEMPAYLATTAQE